MDAGMEANIVNQIIMGQRETNYRLDEIMEELRKLSDQLSRLSLGVSIDRLGR